MTDLSPHLCAPVAAALTGSNQQRTFYVPATGEQSADWWIVLAALNTTGRKIEAFPQLVSLNGAAELFCSTATTQQDIVDDHPGSSATTIMVIPEHTDTIVALDGDNVHTGTHDGLQCLTCDLELFRPGEAFWTLYSAAGYDGSMWCYLLTEEGWHKYGFEPTWPTVTDPAGNKHNLGAVIYGMLATLP